MAFEQGRRLFRRQTETVDQFFMHAVELIEVFAVGEPLVEHQTLVNIVAVFFGQQRRRVQVDFSGHTQRRVEIRLLAEL